MIKRVNELPPTTKTSFSGLFFRKERKSVDKKEMNFMPKNYSSKKITYQIHYQEQYQGSSCRHKEISLKQKRQLR